MKFTRLIYILLVVLSSWAAAGGQTTRQPPESKSPGQSGTRAVNQTFPPDDPPPASEAEIAFSAYASIADFEKLPKYGGLPAADFKFYRSHYTPAIEGVVIETDLALTARLLRVSEPVFRLHAVERQCAVVLLKSRLPTVFTWKLAFVSLTTRDLEILTDEELTALVAHEIGHLYFTDELSEARIAKDDRLARATELKCDLLAMETLRRFSTGAANLITAIEKLTAARHTMNLPAAGKDSPSIADRRQLTQLFVKENSTVSKRRR